MSFQRSGFFVAVALCLSLVGATGSSVNGAEPVKVVMIGDSTMASYPKPPEDRPDLTGWGQVFGEFFNENVKFLNHASSGRSSKSFIAEGRWTKALADKPNFVFIQFGHNDSPGKGDRSTDPNGDFRDNLKKYIAESREIGAKPILVTPVAVRSLTNGKINNARLEPYVVATIAVGEETKTPVIDLNAASIELFEKIGDPAGEDLNPKKTDLSHFSRKGATAVAELVAVRLPGAEPELAKFLAKPASTKVSP